MYYILRNRFYNTEAVAFPMGEGDRFVLMFCLLLYISLFYCF
ncbi:hypothetical protein HMPREF2141_00496 [Bacteroides uniformis]|uniref:Uncharacterized protein n=1 Tax=Bacteroides uniformis (strain ATCC 8492 / DSM 6597 / CCUG 4942 / CIP 103695 / JCM 5828 / KCTC 5204 / NCTC 13054 / VPI 0061) TaxID=411479 RepID=A0ABC9N9B1_BACUC|nr:hypothetical protein BACUNI_03333 [Bacteroides uniformis ATCC 8492]KDS60979.1 hypothetical protein M093_2660 [Bacteroides uniformis str. 3978 T3 i]KXT38383.1 hypothetical protein HMPREF2141_00496 [Bacteroides uniformis]